jgi:hypothetical protein
MTHISITKLYDILSHKIGREGAENLTTFIEHKINNELENKAQMIATKEDLYQVKSELLLKMSEWKSETIKWMFIFWVGQVVATFGFILLFLRK